MCVSNSFLFERKEGGWRGEESSKEREAEKSNQKKKKKQVERLMDANNSTGVLHTKNLQSC